MITIEPGKSSSTNFVLQCLYLGLYIPWDFLEIPVEYRGFASRLEDDILITTQGCEILTRTCPKEIADLYSLLDQRDLSTRSSP